MRRKSLKDTKRENAQAMNYLAKLSDKPLIDVPAGSVKRGPQTRRTDGPKLESEVSAEIVRAAKQFGNVKLWRNNRGQVMLPNGGRLSYGVGPNGASDFIGYRRITITQDMVGQRIAQFLAVESKRPNAHGTDPQLEFIARVESDGGCAGIAHDSEEALRIIRGKL